MKRAIIALLLGIISGILFTHFWLENRIPKDFAFVGSRNNKKVKFELTKFTQEEKKLIHDYYPIAVKNLDDPEEYFLFKVSMKNKHFKMTFYHLNALPLEGENDDKTFTFSSGSIWAFTFDENGQLIKTDYFE